MLVVEREKLPEDGGEEGEEAAVAEHLVMMVMVMMVMMVMVMMVMVMMVLMVAEHLSTVLGDQHQVWPVDGQGLRQRHLARPF